MGDSAIPFTPLHPIGLVGDAGEPGGGAGMGFGSG